MQVRVWSKHILYLTLASCKSPGLFPESDMLVLKASSHQGICSSSKTGEMGSPFSFRELTTVVGVFFHMETKFCYILQSHVTLNCGFKICLHASKGFYEILFHGKKKVVCGIGINCSLLDSWELIG